MSLVPTIFSDIWEARLFPPRTAAVVQNACALRQKEVSIREHTIRHLNRAVRSVKEAART
jgi:hypothetical protein